MTIPASISSQRARLISRLFPRGVPALWCPPLTHYDSDGRIDRARISAHLRHLSTNVPAFLLPGSTGDGWELSEQETTEVVEIALQLAGELKAQLLIGILKANAGEALAAIQQTVACLKARTKQSDPQTAMLAARVCGFAICPPRGAGLSQDDMRRALSPIFASGLPLALYQLPQMTQNEIAPELVEELAARFPNFILLKDSSGFDRVVLSGMDLGGVFTMRGAETDYARWFKATGGPYDGYLLSTANCFAKELDEMIGHLLAGR